MPRINYVCTLWTGPRRTDGDKPPDAWHYLVHQLEALEARLHDLAQITFVLNRYTDERNGSILGLIPSSLQDTPVVVHTRPNVGLSYGAFNCAFENDPTFDYYIFIEDDYVPVIDNFDEILFGLFVDDRRDPMLGYLCTHYAAPHPEYGPHAAIANGLISREALQAIQPLVIPDGEPYKTQIAFSRAFEKAGYGVRDFSHKYRAPFFDRFGIRDFAPGNFKCLFAPVQMLR